MEMKWKMEPTSTGNNENCWGGRLQPGDTDGNSKQTRSEVYLLAPGFRAPSSAPYRQNLTASQVAKKKFGYRDSAAASQSRTEKGGFDPERCLITKHYKDTIH